MKLTLTVMPTQTTPSAGELNEAAIVFDGKTFTVTFTQTAGKSNIHDYSEVSGVGSGQLPLSLYKLIAFVLLPLTNGPLESTTSI